MAVIFQACENHIFYFMLSYLCMSRAIIWNLFSSFLFCVIEVECITQFELVKSNLCYSWVWIVCNCIKEANLNFQYFVFRDMISRSSLEAACEAAAKVNAVLIAKGKLKQPAPQIIKVSSVMLMQMVIKF